MVGPGAEGSQDKQACLLYKPGFLFEEAGDKLQGVGGMIGWARAAPQTLGEEKGPGPWPPLGWGSYLWPSLVLILPYLLLKDLAPLGGGGAWACPGR